MMYMCPSTVSLEALDGNIPVWAADAQQATAELGEKIAWRSWQVG